MNKKFITKEDNKILIFGIPLYYLWLLGILFAFIGWFGENTYKLIDDGFIDSRFHLLPFIGGYILVPIVIHIVLGSTDNLTLFGHQVFKEKNTKNKIFSNILCFMIISLGVFLGELIIGNIWDYFFDVKLWDYSGMFLSITQYTSLFTTLLYGSIAYLFFKFIFSPSLNLLSKKVSYKTAKVICLTLGLLILFDEIRLFLTIIIKHEAPQFWKLIIFKK